MTYTAESVSEPKALSTKSHVQVCVEMGNFVLTSRSGNEQFGYFAPTEEVCLGAEQHDIGWLTWELNLYFLEVLLAVIFSTSTKKRPRAIARGLTSA